MMLNTPRKIIPGFSRYSITTNGKIYNKKQHCMAQHKNGAYMELGLFNDCDNKRVTCRVNRMVAFAYIPNPEGFPVVNHKNGVSTDNRVENLEWCTKKHNSLESERLGLRNKFKKPVVQMALDCKYIAEFESAAEAERITGIDARHISLVCVGKGLTAKGYRWRFKDDAEWTIPKRKTCKRIEKIDPTTKKLIKTYLSMGDIVKEYSTTHSCLRNAINNQTLLKGYLWNDVVVIKKIDPLILEIQEWVIIEGYNGRISKDGKIYTEKYKRLRNPSKNRKGYMSVTLGRKKTAQIHVLVAKAYIPNPKNLHTINHKNGIKTDNRVENLEWASASQQTLHAHDTGLLKTRKSVIQYSKTGKEIDRYKSIAEAAKKMKIGESSLSGAVNGRFKTSAGYIWRFTSNPL